MRAIALTKRLSSVAELVREGAVLADVGTDHAYLPIYLLQSGRISAAICSDVNQGPLEIAKRNAREHGVTEKIELILADGADALVDRDVTDVTVCGMGGELIASIIERAPHLRRRGLWLILQPMSRHAHLRSYLARAGFCTVSERYTLDAGKYYLTLAVEYTGECREISMLEAETGESGPRASLSSEKREYLANKASALSKSIEGKRRGGQDTSADEELYGFIRSLL